MPSARSVLWIVASLALPSVACDSRNYIYRPAENTSAVIAGRAASYYTIPPTSPRGDVRIATFGLVDIRTTDGDDGEVRGVHLRMIVANNSDAPWKIDTREQRLTLPGNGESRPAYATVDQGAAPLVEIPPRDKRQIDLFYPLPPGMQKASELPSFDTVWQVQTGSELVVERTPFERLDVTPVYERYPYYYGSGYWGPSYYYDPWYSHGAFVGARLGPTYVDRPVVIERHPTRPPPARRVR